MVWAGTPTPCLPTDMAPCAGQGREPEQVRAQLPADPEVPVPREEPASPEQSIVEETVGPPPHLSRSSQLVLVRVLFRVT